MSQRYESIIVATEGSPFSRAAEQTALELAKQHGAKVFIVDTIRPPSFVSKWLSNYQDLFDVVVADKQERLEKIAEEFREAGIATEFEVAIGKSSDEIVRAAMEKNADLVVRYMKGPKSQRAHAFGATAINLSHVCPCPLLLVGDQPVTTPTVLACINCEHDEDENEPIIQEALKLAGSVNKPLAMYCWKFYGADFLKEYVDEDTIRIYEEEAEKNYHGLYDRFLQKHDLKDFEQVSLEHGDPIDSIPVVCRDRSVDVVVMCHASHHWLHASTFEAVLGELRCAVLVVKPTGFKPPVAAVESSRIARP